MYKVAVKNEGSYLTIDFTFGSMEEASIFIGHALSSSTEKIECIITKEVNNDDL